MNYWLPFVIFSQGLLLVQSKNVCQKGLYEGKCLKSEGSRHVQSEVSEGDQSANSSRVFGPSRAQDEHHNEIAFVLLSQYNGTSTAYELSSFHESLVFVKGILLHKAVSDARLDIVRQLIHQGADLNLNNRNGVTPLFKAIESNNSHIVETLLKCGADPNFSVTNMSLLHIAVLRGDLEVMLGLIRLGAKVDPRDSSGKTPLYYGVELNRTSGVPLLLTAGADINSATEDGKSLLHIAATENSMNVVKSLVRLQVQIDKPDISGRTPLYTALVLNNSQMSTFLLQNGASINFVAENGNSPSHIAILEGNAHVIDKIIELDGNISIPNIDGLTPFHLAIFHNNYHMMKYLIDKYIDVNERMGIPRDFPIHYVIRNGTKRALQILLDHGAFKTVQDHKGLTPLIQSVFLDKFEMTSLLLENRTFALLEVNYNADRNNNKPLHISVQNGNLKAAQKLLELGSNPNATNKKGKTPLYIAVEKDNIEMMNLLLAMNADVRYKNLERGETLLHVAVKKKSLKAAEKLLELGLDTESVNNRGFTPLFDAVTSNNTQMMTLLVSKGADVNFIHYSGETVLLRAVSNSTLATVKVLVESGAHVEPPRRVSSIMKAVELNRLEVVKYLLAQGVALVSKRRSLLHLSARQGSTDVLRLLLRLGVPVDLKESELTPLWAATKRNQLSAMRVLLENGADTNIRVPHPFPTRDEGTGSPTWSLIHETVYRDLVNATALLLEGGVDVNSVEYRSWTPLHYATAAQKRELVTLLMSHGADPNARTKNGITPKDLAKYGAEGDALMEQLEESH